MSKTNTSPILNTEKNIYAEVFRKLGKAKETAESEFVECVSEGGLHHAQTDYLNMFFGKLSSEDNGGDGGKKVNTPTKQPEISSTPTDLQALFLHSPFFETGGKAFNSFVEISEEMVYFHRWYNVYSAFKSFLDTELNAAHAAALLYCYKNKVVYRGLMMRKLLFDLDKVMANPGALKRQFKRLVKLGILIEVERAEIAELREVGELERNLQEYTQMGAAKFEAIHYHVLSEFGGILVAGFLEELEAVVPERVLRRIYDGAAVIVPENRVKEQEMAKVAVDERKVVAERRANLRVKQEEKLLKLCLPFKPKIIGLNRQVVMGQPHDGGVFSKELMEFVEGLQKKERFISPLGVRVAWQRWRGNAGAK